MSTACGGYAIPGPEGPAGPAGPTGPAGTNGTVWTVGEGAPIAPGANGDLYLDTLTGNIYEYNALLATWSITGNIPIGGGVDAPWLFDVTEYGALADCKVIADGSIAATSTTLTSASGGFADAEAGMSVLINRAGASGVTAFQSTILSVTNATTVVLADPAVTTSTNTVVFFGTDDTNACNAAIDAAEAYLAAGASFAEVFTPRFCALAGALRTNKSGNGLLVFGPLPTDGVKKHLIFSGPSTGGAAVRHWQQEVPQMAGGGYVAFGVYPSIAAQINDINNNGNPAIICGPNEGSGYGVSANYANIIPVVRNLTLMNAHSDFGLTYGAVNAWGCANAHIENVAIGTVGIVPGVDYVSPNLLANGLSIGLMMPAPGNNDYVFISNLSIQGGYTYAMFLTEHAVVDRYMALYCWAGIVPVGTYAGSVGSVHAMKVLSASIEACINDVYIYGAGSSGIGPTIDIDQLSTETSTFNITGTSTAAMEAAKGLIKLTGLFTESGVSVSSPCGIKIVNGQEAAVVRTITTSQTLRVIDETVLVNASGGAVVPTLISAVATPNRYTVKKIDASANAVTVTAAVGQTIDGSNTFVLNNQWDTVTVLPDGTGNWVTV